MSQVRSVYHALPYHDLMILQSSLLYELHYGNIREGDYRNDMLTVLEHVKAALRTYYTSDGGAA